MKRPRSVFRLTLVASILASIILPILVTPRPIDWNRFFFIVAVSITLIWFFYAVILLVITFLIEGRRNIKKRLRDGITDKWGFS